MTKIKSKIETIIYQLEEFSIKGGHPPVRFCDRKQINYWNVGNFFSLSQTSVQFWWFFRKYSPWPSISLYFSIMQDFIFIIEKYKGDTWPGRIFSKKSSKLYWRLWHGEKIPHIPIVHLFSVMKTNRGMTSLK